MVAFVASIIVTVLLVMAVVWFMGRRPVGTVLTWGEAMAAAAYIFFLLFWVYGVVPHQWLTWAEGELFWAPSKALVGPELAWTGDQGILAWALPFDMNYRVIKDLVAVIIYGVALAGNVALWAMWQNRGKKDAPPAPTSEYGRPLVREGAGVA